MSPQTKGLDFIPYTEKKPMEIQATCHHLPCDSAVSPCQEEPQVSSVFWCALQGLLQLTSLDTSSTPGSTWWQCVYVCVCVCVGMPFGQILEFQSPVHRCFTQIYHHYWVVYFAWLTRTLTLWHRNFLLNFSTLCI